MRIPPEQPQGPEREPRRPRRTREPGQRRLSNKGRIILIVIVAALFILFLSARGIASFYTDYLWFDSLGFGRAFTRVLTAKIVLAVIFSGFFAVVLFVNLTVADRMAPPLRGTGPDEQVIERYRQIIGKRAWLIRLAVSVIFGLIAGVGVSSQWQQWLLFTHSQSFGVKDPQFHKDVSFYVFRLPFISYVIGWAFASFVIIIVITTVVHYLNGGIRLNLQSNRVTPHVKLHLSLLLGVLALLKAVGYYYQRFELLGSTRGYVNGATYTDIKAQLPAIELLALISLLAFALLIFNVRQRGWRLPVLAVGLWALIAVVAGSAYPAFVQRFQVQPAQSVREEPYIARNITATQAALGLDNVQVTPLPVSATAPASANSAADNLGNVRLLDPSLVAATFKQLKSVKSYYTFNDLDVDRYTVDGKTSQFVVAVRELNANDLPSRSWENIHLAYTHGNGLVVAPASRAEANGRPIFADLAASAINLTRPEVYFGEGLGSYAVVNTKRQEVGFSETDAAVEPTTTYQGNGGVTLGGGLRRLAFFLRFGEPNLLVSNLISSSSRILYIRDIRDRVTTVAPFLKLDADPYPVVDNGRIKWVLDAYTTTDRYPYAQLSRAELPSGSGLAGARFNYVRNSVKAVVDSYDGTVTLYVVDPTDPIARAYESAFPELFTAKDQVPPSLAAHFRYPEDLFRVQTQAWARYHITDAQKFYDQKDAWAVAQDPGNQQQSGGTVTITGSTGTTVAGIVQGSNSDRVPPYYTLLRQPGDSSSQFVLLRSFVPFSDQDNRKELVSFMTASSDPGTYGQLRVYTTSGANGELPSGPAIVASDVSSAFGQVLTLIDQKGSKVTFGDLQLVPLEGSLMWIRPWFISAEGTTPIPEMRYVSITLGRESYLGCTLEQALTQAFGSSPNLNTVDGDVLATRPDDCQRAGSGGGTGTGTGTGTGSTTTVAPTTTAPGGSTTTTPTTTVPVGGKTVEQVLADAQAAYDAAQVALKAGNLGLYQSKLEEAYKLAAAAASMVTGGPVTATTTTTAGTTTTITVIATTTTAAPATTTATTAKA